MFGIGDLSTAPYGSQGYPCLALLNLEIGPKYLVAPRPGFEGDVEGFLFVVVAAAVAVVLVPGEGPQAFQTAALK